MSSITVSAPLADGGGEWDSSASEDEQEVDNATLEPDWWNSLFSRAEAETCESAGGDGDASIEWLLSWRSSGRFFAPWLPQNTARRTIAIGTGNSSFPVEMHLQGYCPSLVCSDFSRVVIAYMAQRHAASAPCIEWEVQDARNLSYADASIHLVLDKSLLECVAGVGAQFLPLQSLVVFC